MSHGAEQTGSEAPAARPTDFRALYRKLEHALAEIERTENIADTLERILDTLVAAFRRELGFEGGRIYRRDDGEYFLCCGFGTSSDTPVGLRVPPDYAPHLETLDRGLLIMRKGDSGYDEAFERSIGVESTFAAIAVGKQNEYVIAFSIAGDVQEERILYSLTALRHVINLKLEQQRFTGMIEEARAIQESMLPAARPDVDGWDVAGRSCPAERVGGDLFDYLPLPRSHVGIAIADATGHGLPAALIARDVITGLRTLVGGDDPLTRTMETLNRIVHRQALSSKFVSLFYGEIDPGGSLVYCNAGHNAPLLLRAGSCTELQPGGPVLGPIPGARYELGRERLEPGDALVLFTDGVVERANAAGETFGGGRLQELFRSTDLGAEARVQSIYSAVERHADGTIQADDMTVVVARRTGG